MQEKISHKMMAIVLSILTLSASIFLFTQSNSSSTLAAEPTVDDYIIVSGYAWNQKTGWIKQRGIVANELIKEGNYGVKINRNTNKVTGWSWSSIYGWVCWGSTCQDDPELSAHIAEPPCSDGKCYGSVSPPVIEGYIDTADASVIDSLGNNPPLVGWAKIIQLGSAGWIKLSSTDGALPVYGTTFDNSTKQFDGWAWSCVSADPENPGAGCNDAISLGWIVFSGKTLVDETLSDTSLTCQDEICETASIDSSSGVTQSRWYTEIIAPWLQTQGGNIYSKGDGVTGFDTPSDELKPPVLNGGFNASYLIHSNGAIQAQWLSECRGVSGGDSCGPSNNVQTPHEQIMAFDVPRVENNYRNQLGFINIAALTTINPSGKNKYGYNVSASSSEQLSQDFSAPLNDSVLFVDGDLNIGSSEDRGVLYVLGGTESSPSGAGTVVVQGDIHIYRPIEYVRNGITSVQGTPSVAWIAIKRPDGLGGYTGGNIYIDNCLPPPSNTADAALISGAFIAEGQITTGFGGSNQGDKGEGLDIQNQCTPGTLDTKGLPQEGSFGLYDIPLQVDGIMMAQNFTFQRVYTGNDTGAESIRDDGRLMTNVPPGLEDFTKTLPIWRSSHIFQ